MLELLLRHAVALGTSFLPRSFLRHVTGQEDLVPWPALSSLGSDSNRWRWWGIEGAVCERVRGHGGRKEEERSGGCGLTGAEHSRVARTPVTHGNGVRRPAGSLPPTGNP